MMLLSEKMYVQREKRRRPRRPRTEHCGKPNLRGWGEEGQRDRGD